MVVLHGLLAGLAKCRAAAWACSCWKLASRLDAGWGVPMARMEAPVWAEATLAVAVELVRGLVAAERGLALMRPASGLSTVKSSL